MKNETQISEMINERLRMKNIIQNEIDRINDIWSKKKSFYIGENVKCQIVEIKQLFEDGTGMATRRVNRLNSEIVLLTEMLN